MKNKLKTTKLSEQISHYINEVAELVGGDA